MFSVWGLGVMGVGYFDWFYIFVNMECFVKVFCNYVLFGLLIN